MLQKPQKCNKKKRKEKKKHQVGCDGEVRTNRPIGIFKIKKLFIII